MKRSRRRKRNLRIATVRYLGRQWKFNCGKVDVTFERSRIMRRPRWGQTGPERGAGPGLNAGLGRAGPISKCRRSACRAQRTCALRVPVKKINGCAAWSRYLHISCRFIDINCLQVSNGVSRFNESDILIGTLRTRLMKRPVMDHLSCDVLRARLLCMLCQGLTIVLVKISA